jgi:type VI secretion system protein ImpG
VTSVLGHGIGADSEQQFLPFYASYSTDEEHRRSAYFTVRREPRLISIESKRRGNRSSYIGSEVFLSLVDSAQAPFSGDLRQLSIQTLCTNRDLVLQMPVGIAKNPDGTPKGDFKLDVTAPVARISVVSGPSRPYGALADGPVAWRAISHLSLNYLSLVDSSPEQGAAALRDLLELYASGSDLTARKQIDGLRSVRVERIVDRLPPPRDTASRRREAQRLAFGRGLEIAVDVDELAFEGGSAFLLGSVLHHYFARYVSMNSFTKTTLRSLSRGEIHRWMPEWGARPTL